MPSYAVIIRAIHERGESQKQALAELDRRGLWLSPEQRRQAGLRGRGQGQECRAVVRKVFKAPCKPRPV